MSRDCHVAIVGAGITGLAFAALLANRARSGRLRLSLIDAAPRPYFDAADDVGLRVSAIALGSVALLEEVGAWDAIIAARACAYDRMRVWDASDSVGGASTLRFDAAEFAVPHLGFIVENALLQDALLRVLDRTDVELHFETPLEQLVARGERFVLQLEGGRSLEPDLVVGADGAASRVREGADIDTRAWPYQQTAFVTHLRPEKIHRDTAWQRFLADGPLGMLPLADGRVSIVWSTRPELAAEAVDASDAELGRMLGEASDYVLGELQPAAPRGTFPLWAHHAGQYVAPGLALIGDAAHAVHPLAGQGANLGLQDASELARVIVAAQDRGEVPGDRPVLRRYERARKGANATMLHFVTGLNRLFATDSALARQLRTTGMQLFNSSGPLRDRAVGVALGTGR